MLEKNNKISLNTICLNKSLTGNFTKSTIVDGTNPDEFKKFDDVSILAHVLVNDNRSCSDYFGALIDNIGIEDLINRHHLSGEILRAKLICFLNVMRL